MGAEDMGGTEKGTLTLDVREDGATRFGESTFFSPETTEVLKLLLEGIGDRRRLQNRKGQRIVREEPTTEVTRS